MPINKKEITKAQLLKAMQCKSADELMALIKAEGYDITKEEAEAYFAAGRLTAAPGIDKARRA